MMFDFKLLPGAEKKWMANGKLVAVLRSVKKRQIKRGCNDRSKRSVQVVRILTPAEYEAEKLTRRNDRG
jgi:hypothetical protein